MCTISPLYTRCLPWMQAKSQMAFVYVLLQIWIIIQSLNSNAKELIGEKKLFDHCQPVYHWSLGQLTFFHATQQQQQIVSVFFLFSLMYFDSCMQQLIKITNTFNRKKKDNQSQNSSHAPFHILLQATVLSTNWSQHPFNTVFYQMIKIKMCESYTVQPHWLRIWNKQYMRNAGCGHVN